jgi:CRISPR-associated protein Csb2
LEIAFATRTSGPLVMGDGRYLGLGLMAPIPKAGRDALAFPLLTQTQIAVADGPLLLHAMRRALMALARDQAGRVPRLFSGHQEDGEAAASGQHEHIFLAADDNDGDGRIDRVIVAAPWICDKTVRPSRKLRATFDRVVSMLETVRAGRLGVIALGRPAAFAERDLLTGPAREWESRTPYRPTRHAGRRKDQRVALVRDLVDECRRRGLPRPEVEVLVFSAGPSGGGVSAQARLSFATAIRGPLLLGRDSHGGGGMFAAQS